ncbi:MAG: uncharacterized protein JWN07_479 [Hyphomicrobiales bacterium]|nr:uncharacterized protein [Hyphomicrobiales bacterium]
MIRFLLRAAALLLLAAAFVALVLDGARSIAASGLSLLDIGALAQAIAPQKLAQLQPAAERLSPALWDPVLVTALKGPAFLYLALLGALLLRLTRPAAPKIGYSSRP